MKGTAAAMSSMAAQQYGGLWDAVKGTVAEMPRVALEQSGV